MANGDAATAFHLHLREEKVNAAVHGIGLLLSIAGAAVLLATAIRHGGAWQWGSCAFYVATMIATYLASTLSHLFMRPRLRLALRMADQAMIFLFIAGSYAPVALTWLRTPPPWWLLHAAIGITALSGFLSKSVFAHRVAAGSVSTVLQMSVSWLPVLATQPLLHYAPGRLLLWFLAGGFCYSIGIIFFHFDHRIRYFHAAWHTWVIGGSACHFFGILFYCTGMPR